MTSYRTDEQLGSERGLTAAQVQRLQITRGITAQGLRAIPDEALRRALRRLEYPDMPRARESFRRLQQQDERGEIPRNALVNAIRQLDSTRARAAAPRQVAGVPTGRAVQPRALVSPLAGLLPGGHRWVSLGPGNIGGRTRSIVIHPQAPNVIWAGSVAGGVWRTDDGGQSWQAVDDFMVNLAVTCMVMDPTNPDIIYAGTGEGFFNSDSIRGAGIFRTVDGLTWNQLPSTTGPEFHNVNRLAISRDGKTLLAATPTGLFRNSDPDRLSWTPTLNIAMADVKFHPLDSNRAVAGTLRDGQAYYSTNGGQTWSAATHAAPWAGRVEVTYAVANPSVVYASVKMDTGEIWRSSNGGRSYRRRNSLLTNGGPARYLGDQGWYDNVIWAGDPTNSNLVIVGGIDVWKSTNAGNILRPISTWWDRRSAHADQHCIVADPRFDGVANKTVYFGNDGGVFKTDDLYTLGNDPGEPRIHGWQELVNTYGVTQFFAGAGNPNTGIIIGGTQDNGTLRYNPAVGTEGWTEMFGGDGGWCAADPADPNYFYGEYVFLNVHRSTDGGVTSEYISGQYWNGQDWVWKPIPYRIPDVRNSDALFIAPFILDPNEPNRLLAGGLSLWRTNDAKSPNTQATGPAWIGIKGSAGSLISAIAVSRGHSDIIWVGHEDGQIYATANGTAGSPLWQKVDSVGPNPLSAGRYCTGITIDPQDPNTTYVTFGGYVRGNVWKTIDGGATWSNIGNALPEAPVRALTVHPRRTNFVYLGTEIGVFTSEDGGATWSPTNEGPTNCSVDDLFWMNEALVCVTHGRGMFRIDLSGV
jgi:photosystem II stability/assembly factor-like uncharacterized protein